ENPSWINNLVKQAKSQSKPAAIWAMRGETRCAAINLTNATEKPMRVRIAAKGLPSSAGLQPIRKVIWTDTHNSISIADALVKIKPQDHGIVEIPAGVTQQIWLAFKPVTSGQFTGQLNATVISKKVSPDHKYKRKISVPIQVNVFD